MRFATLTTRQQVAHLGAYGLSSLCTAYLLDVTHKQVRRHRLALGMGATTRSGGECAAMMQASLIRYLASLGIAAPVVRYCAGCDTNYQRKAMRRRPRSYAQAA